MRTVGLFFNACFLLQAIQFVAAERVTVTLTTEELQGDSHTKDVQNKPLVVHVDQESLTPDMIQHLSRTSNIIVPNLLDLPEFINPLEFHASEPNGNLVDQIASGNIVSPEAVKNDPRFLELVSFLRANANITAPEREDTSNSKATPSISSGDVHSSLISQEIDTSSSTKNRSNTSTNATASYDSFKQYNSSPRNIVPFLTLLGTLIPFAF